MICYGCAVSCHKDHPVIYVEGNNRNAQKGCFCKDSKNNKCKLNVGVPSLKKDDKSARKPEADLGYTYGSSNPFARN